MSHAFLRFVPPRPRRRILRDVAVSLLNRYFNTDASRSKLEKAVPQPIRWFTESKDEQEQADAVKDAAKAVTSAAIAPDPSNLF